MTTDIVFARIVNEDVREQASADNAALLRSPDNLDRWKDALLDIKFNVEKQLANHKAEVAKARGTMPTRDEWLEFMAEKERWRAATIRLLNGVNRRLVEVRSLRRRSNVETIYQAVLAHRAAIEADEDAADADEALWEAVLGA